MATQSLPQTATGAQTIQEALSAYVSSGQTTMKLSAELGYKSDVVRQWIKSGNVPGHMVDFVFVILGKHR